MKLRIVNCLIIILFTLLMILTNYKKSGGDIFIQLMILGFAIVQSIILLTVRLFVKFNVLKALLWLLIGLLISLLIFQTINFFAVN